MGKRSRQVQTRRAKQELLVKATQRRALTNLRAGAFCCIAAMMSDRFGSASAIAWMIDNCLLPEQDAAEAIAIGRSLLARDRAQPESVATA
jgi:hypothetical protein